MRRTALLAVGFLIPFLWCPLAQAQSARTWVAANGDDISATCSRTAPCKTFAGAISKTLANGEINCVDSAGYGVITITKSITIDCHDVYASVLAGSGQTGITVDMAGINVTLRNLNVDGSGVGARGISILRGAQVHIEDVMVMGFTLQAIADVRTAGAGNVLSVKNTVVRNNSGAGVSAAGSAGTGAIIDNLHSISNGFGVAVATGNNVVVNRSVLVANLTAGVQADAGSQVGVDNTVVSHNASGVTGAGTVWLANTDIAYNSTGVGSATTSFGNNRIFGNTSAGTAPTVGAASSDHGQQ